MLTPFKTADFNNQFGRTLGKISWRAASLGECETAAGRIEDGNLDSWLAVWRELADGLAKTADACLAAGHRSSAADCYLRASEYYRQATFFHRVDLDNPDLQKGWPRVQACFIAGTRAAGMAVEPVQIPFEGKYFSGYLFRAETTDTSAPLVIAPSGYDGTAEESAIMVAMPALRRGYHALTFDGPGQGPTLYDPARRLFMRPDWENVLPAVVDFAVAQPGIDAERLVACGVSFGGFLVPRGVSGEPRIAALIADPGQYDIGAGIKAMLPAKLAALLDTDSKEADAAFQPMLADIDKQLLFLPRMAAHGCTSLRAYLQDLMRYTSAEQAGSIHCPSLICDNETDAVSTGQGAKLAAAIGKPATAVRFTVAQGAAGHCEGVGREIFEQVAFDWLDATLSRTPR